MKMVGYSIDNNACEPCGVCDQTERYVRPCQQGETLLLVCDACYKRRSDLVELLYRVLIGRDESFDCCLWGVVEGELEEKGEEVARETIATKVRELTQKTIETLEGIKREVLGELHETSDFDAIARQLISESDWTKDRKSSK